MLGSCSFEIPMIFKWQNYRFFSWSEESKLPGISLKKTHPLKTHQGFQEHHFRPKQFQAFCTTFQSPHVSIHHLQSCGPAANLRNEAAILQDLKLWNPEIPGRTQVGSMGPILPRWLEKVPKNRLSQIVVWFMVIYPWHKVKKKTLLRQIQVGGSNGIYDPLVHSLDSYIVYMSL